MLPDLILSQATDLFRIGLMVALVYTAFRQRQATGLLLPIALGVLFFAALLPTVMGPADGVPFATAFATGVVVNAVWAGIAVLIWAAWTRRKG